MADRKLLRKPLENVSILNYYTALVIFTSLVHLKIQISAVLSHPFFLEFELLLEDEASEILF
jgi:hypothetical protein